MIKPIKTEKQYDQALAYIYELMQQKLKTNSEAANELEVYSILVKEYESKHYPMPLPNPIEVIKFRLEQMGLGSSDLNVITGNRSRKSEILNGKRKLSLTVIRALHDKLKIPAEILIASY